ncbi:MAG: GNAT family N-acetyltransferase [Anaerolineaceae bacterium]|nr:GNAT family N-acetyltransferase [Anaerolineaceae bacterium]
MKQLQIEISLVTEVDASLEASFAQLIPQLTKNNPPPDQALLRKIVDAENTHILIARDQEAYGKIVGALTLALYTTPTGTKAWIEDVIVDNHYRGKGIGKRLTLQAIDMAKKKNAKAILLTSNAARVEANKLYQKLGFTLRNTNFYQLTL